MAEDQRNARIFGVLYLLTFITSIPALLLYEPALRHPEAFARGQETSTRSISARCLSFSSSSRTSEPPS